MAGRCDPGQPPMKRRWPLKRSPCRHPPTTDLWSCQGLSLRPGRGCGDGTDRRFCARRQGGGRYCRSVRHSWLAILDPSIGTTAGCGGRTSAPPADTNAATSALQVAYGRAATERVEIACGGGGVGRTGTALAAIAVLAGVPRSEAVVWVRHRYNRRAAETPRQRRWVLNIEGARYAESGTSRRPITSGGACVNPPSGCAVQGAHNAAQNIVRPARRGAQIGAPAQVGRRSRPREID